LTLPGKACGLRVFFFVPWRPSVRRCEFSMNFTELIPTLEVAIGPVILISGVGSLLVSMTNRFGQVIDLSRQNAGRLRDKTGQDRVRLGCQLEILVRRSRLLRLSIALAIVSILLACLLIIILFITALLRSDLGIPITVCFMACMASLIGAVVVLLMDVNLSLADIKLEIAGSSEAAASTGSTATSETESASPDDS